MTIYTYQLRNRPAMYGTVPEKRRVDLDTAAPLPYGTVSYERPLTPREIYSFELIPVSPEPVLPLYPAGSQVKDMRNGKIYTVELFDGEYWIRDDFMRTIRDWLFYEPYAPPLSTSDNDYLWQADANVYPSDTLTYEPDPVLAFQAEADPVVTQYVDGTLQVVVNKILDKSQVKAYCTGARRIPGVKDCELDNAAQFASGYTAFCIIFNPKYARRLEDVRAAARDYTERFLKELQPTTVQAGLFDAVPIQTSLF